MRDLIGKTAIVTGASKGIGKATVMEFASLGVTVIAASRNVEQLNNINTDGPHTAGQVHPIQCDVSNYKDVKKITQFALSLSGKIDILINNAGLIEPISKLADSSPEEWANVADVNYKGVYFCIRSVLPTMLGVGEGVIVNVSTGAATSPREGWSHYCSSKAGALMLTKMVHHEYAQSGVRAVGLSPGTVDTDMQVSIRKSGLNPISKLPANVHTPVSIPAKIIAWLCTTDAKEFDGDDVSLKDPVIQKRAGLR
ncbi:MAG: SDR family oxidoreductase [Alphaproteobacteria bacterium]|nr:SDR family oxidoreductase [Alphaproteobacteria bacterium]